MLLSSALAWQPRLRRAPAERSASRLRGARPVVTALAEYDSAKTAAGRVRQRRVRQAKAGGTSSQAYERAKQEARAAALAEERALEAWTAAKYAEGVRTGDAAGGESITPEVVRPEVVSGGVSGALGFCSGKACRVLGDAAAFGLGAAFVFVSLLSRAGYVTINYSKVERDLLSVLGEVDANRTVSLLADHGISNAAGFAAGFALGFNG